MNHRSLDARLYESAKAGNRTAFEELVRRYRSLISAVAHKITRDPVLGEDIVQDTFLEAWRRLDDLRNPDSLRYWLVGIARNKSRQALTRRSRHPSTSLDALAEEGNVFCDRPSPLDSALDRELRAEVSHLMTRVPAAYQQTLHLFYLESLSVKQIADQLSLSTDAVKQRLTRGRRCLRQQASAAEKRQARTIGKPGRRRPGRAYRRAGSEFVSPVGVSFSRR
ncbi:MAG: sigma-70 family RNA polymerase sigma factor [Myxococcota bacterium]